MNKVREGYVLVLSLIIMGLLVLIATQVYNLSYNFSAYSHFVIKREKAKMLALSGVQLMRDVLYSPPLKEEKGKDSKTPEKEKGSDQKKAPEKDEAEAKGNKGSKEDSVQKKKKEDAALGALLIRVLPLLNQWQKLKLTQQKDGVDGEIKTYLACEDGKLHLNHLLGLTVQKGLSEERTKMLQELWQKISQITKAKKSLHGSAKEFFDRRNRVWLNDVSEILEAPGFEVFRDKLFEGLSNGNKEVVSLMDLFTPLSRYAKLDPWVLSASAQKLLGLQPKKIDKNKAAEIGKDFQSAHNWTNDWDKLIKPIYGKEFSALPKGFDLMFSIRFDPAAFSVVSYGIVDDVKQGVYTILTQKKQSDGSSIFVPTKTYWIN
jgi:hypothetical protein